MDVVGPNMGQNGQFDSDLIRSSHSSSQSDSSEDLLYWVTDDGDFDVGEVLPCSFDQDAGSGNVSVNNEFRSLNPMSFEPNFPAVDVSFNGPDAAGVASQHHLSGINESRGQLHIYNNSNSAAQASSRFRSNQPTSSANADDFIELDFCCPPALAQATVETESAGVSFQNGVEFSSSSIFPSSSEIDQDSRVRCLPVPSTSQYYPYATIPSCSQSTLEHSLSDRSPTDVDSRASSCSSSSSSPPSTCSLVVKTVWQDNGDRSSEKSVASGHHRPGSVLVDRAHTYVLLQLNQVSKGSSLTCTVVNILRGLHLLDCCGLEDLCISLYGIQTTDRCDSDTSMNSDDRFPATAPHHFNHDHPPSVYPCESKRFPVKLARSSSFTSVTLLSPRLSTLSGDQELLMARVHSNGQLSHRKHIPPSPMQPLTASSRRFRQVGYLVSYLLNCSHFGFSGVLTGIPPPTPTSSAVPALPLTSAECSVNSCTWSNWRCGRPDYLVRLLTMGPVGMVAFRSMLSHLLAGRFLPGAKAAWSSVWPAPDGPSPGFAQRTAEQQLAEWLFTWMRRGAVPVLAQLNDDDESVAKETSQHLFEHAVPKCDATPSTLTWRHRIVCGVFADAAPSLIPNHLSTSFAIAVVLSNPVQRVSLSTLLHWLSQEAVIRVEKQRLVSLWLAHHHLAGTEADSHVTSDFASASLAPAAAAGGDKAFSGDDLSLLAEQPDPRWASMNILGQLLSTLRTLERTSTVQESHQPPAGRPSSGSGGGHSFLAGASRSQQSSAAGGSASRPPFSGEQSSLSPCIAIPCCKGPGFSLFVSKSDDRLVEALLG